MRLKDKVSIITGAANGLGAKTAEIFAAQGANVVVTDISEAPGQAVVRKILDVGGQAEFRPLNVVKEADWKRVIEEVQFKYGTIDILVNNAAVSGSHPDRLNSETWDQQMEVCARGSFLGMQSVIPIMQTAGQGSIVNVSSVSGLVGLPWIHMGYNAAKGAIRLATKAAAVQFTADGVRVNSVHPGMMPPMQTAMLSGDPIARKERIAKVPIQRVARHEEVAYAILFLASDEASYISGVELPVDGGWTCQ
jgi:NAD(P)-dependent dehydrogenase (short-subunit alcohol dehydrogenase family)